VRRRWVSLATALAALAAVIALTPNGASAYSGGGWGETSSGYVRTTPTLDCEFVSMTQEAFNPVTPYQPYLSTYGSLDWGPNW
jgi:hypothetical protein